jgi:hypothetical protein
MQERPHTMRGDKYVRAALLVSECGRSSISAGGRPVVVKVGLDKQSRSALSSEGRPEQTMKVGL